MRLAVIDLGTNTSNLLIADVFQTDFTILHQSKQLVKLGDGKIRENEISNEATGRAVDSLLNHKNIINHYLVDKVRVLATSAVRTAENKIGFLETLSNESGWIVKVVSGEKEAELIFHGVLLAFGEFAEPSVVLDIGGGSNELILTNGRNMIWKESQPTGMARIINKFHISDPVKEHEISELRNYYAESHREALEKCKSESVRTLIGCSGAFDSIADMIDQVDPGTKIRKTQEIAISDFYKVYKNLIKSTRDERLETKGMDFVRVDLIVPAVIFIEHLISTLGIQKIIQTDFALREGVLYEMMRK